MTEQELEVTLKIIEVINTAIDKGVNPSWVQLELLTHAVSMGVDLETTEGVADGRRQVEELMKVVGLFITTRPTQPGGTA